VQRVDLSVDGVKRNTGQRSDNPAFIRRVITAMQAAKHVEIVRSSSPAPTPAPSSALELAARNVVFVADVDDDVIAGYLSTPARWSLAVTADPAYRSDELVKLIHAAKGAGRVVRPWCDCREPDGDPAGTPFREAVAMARDYDLAEPFGECESVTEYDHAIAAGARLLIGNPNALDKVRRDAATARIAAGALAMIGEELHPDAGYSAAGVPIASVCIYVGPGAGAYYPVADYLAVLTPGQRATFCVYHARAMWPPDWRLLTSPTF
jgi:hypothetical protein